MKKILWINSSISGDKSYSFYAAKNIVDHLGNDVEVEYLDLNKNIDFTLSITSENIEEYFDAKYDKYIDQIKQSDYILINAGMVNFSIPPTLQNYINRIAQANKTFSYKYSGKGKSVGLIPNNKKILFVLSRGSDIDNYEFSKFDHYLASVFSFLGIENSQSFIISGTRTSEKLRLPIEEVVDIKKLMQLSKDFLS